jgi:hypothetical protein
MCNVIDVSDRSDVGSIMRSGVPTTALSGQDGIAARIQMTCRKEKKSVLFLTCKAVCVRLSRIHLESADNIFCISSKGFNAK